MREAGRQRRAERLRYLGSLVAELGHALFLGMQASEEHRQLVVPLLQVRLGYAIGARRDLPRTLALTVLTRVDMAMNEQREWEVKRMVKAALEEIAELEEREQ